LGHFEKMTSIGSIAISGLNAAATRLGVAANNLVNARTSAFATATGAAQGTVYRPQQVAQSTLTTGGVATTVVPVTPPSFIATDPNSPTGFSAYPNVNIGAELVNLSLAASSYKASAQLLSVESEISDSLIDILS
jgi:flagellar basal-body rod protein FlgC